MCLYQSKKFPTEKQIATEDMVVYKYLLVRDGKLIPPYANQRGYVDDSFHYTLGDVFTSRLFDWVDEGWRGHRIHVGLHSLADYPDEKLDKAMREILAVELFMCIIPAGAEYYIGTWEGLQTSYASNQIIIKGKI